MNSVASTASSVASTAMGMLISKNEIKYEEDTFISAKIVRNLMPLSFNIMSTSGFVAGSLQVNKNAIKVLKWVSTGKAETVISDGEQNVQGANLNINWYA